LLRHTRKPDIKESRGKFLFMKKIALIVVSLLSYIFSTAQTQKVLATCTCPTQSNCSSDCLFSKCCVCWDPNVSEGGCGCWFGLAICKTERHEESKVSTANLPSASATVVLSFAKIKDLFSYLQTQKIDIRSISLVLDNLGKKYPNQTEYTGISMSDYSSFQKSYTDFINRLTSEQKDMINNYIKLKSGV
jgi:hypothetical protein